MLSIGSTIIEIEIFWSFFLIMMRFSGVLFALPGIGTDQYGPQWRFYLAIIIALSLTIAGVRMPYTEVALEMILLTVAEFALGALIGSVPGFVLAGLGVAGQVIAGTIGLGQANMIDRSLGNNVSIIAQLKIMFATVVFLILEGHHTIIRFAASLPDALKFFHPDMTTAQLITAQLSHSFELAVMVSAPILVTALITQFILGLVTKFIPQVNIFIISLPLTLGLGLYLIAYSFPGITTHLVKEFGSIERTLRLFF